MLSSINIVSTADSCIEVNGIDVKLDGVLKSVIDNVSASHIAFRDVATHVLVFLLSDLDRQKKVEEILTGWPVYYGFAGRSLLMSSVRALSDKLIDMLRKEGFHVITRG